MDLNDYFDPVSLEPPLIEIIPADHQFSRHIQVHTPSEPLKNLDSFKVAILGVPEDRNSPNKGTSQAPDKVREELYQLARLNRKLPVIDLGNLKRGTEINDTYAGLTDVLCELGERGIVCVIIGGSQDLSLPSFRALKKIFSPVRMVCLDASPDLHPQSPEGMLSLGFLRQIIREKGKALLQLTCMGYQQYLTDKTSIDYLEKHLMDPIRIGQVRDDLRETEPVMRDAHLVSVDIGSVRAADAPGNFRANPNGFYGEEICQIARYSGLGGNTKIFGLFEINPSFDKSQITARMGAQILWYFLEGLSVKTYESPQQKGQSFITYTVSMDELGQEIIFYRSPVTHRWWVEIPGNEKVKPILAACSEIDYQEAAHQVLTDRLWRLYRKIL